MSRSTAVLGSNRETKHNLFTYITEHCVPTGFQSIVESFHYWKLHLKGDTSEYKSFDFLSEEEKLDEVRVDFWHTLSNPDIESMEFMNWLIGMSDNPEPLVLLEENFFDDVEELLSVNNTLFTEQNDND